MLHKQELLHFKKSQNNWSMLFLNYINCALKTVHEFLRSARFFLSVQVLFFLMPNLQLDDGMLCLVGKASLCSVVLSFQLITLGYKII